MDKIEAYCKNCKLHYDIKIVKCHFCKEETVPIRKPNYNKSYKVKFYQASLTRKK